jgi:hypothetical protein
MITTLALSNDTIGGLLAVAIFAVLIIAAIVSEVTRDK